MPSSSGGIVRIDYGETRGRVLIVDDEPLVRWALVTGLRAAGFDCAGRIVWGGRRRHGGKPAGAGRGPYRPGAVQHGLARPGQTDQGCGAGVPRRRHDHVRARSAVACRVGGYSADQEAIRSWRCRPAHRTRDRVSRFCVSRANRRYQSLGNASPSASNVTSGGSPGASRREGAILNIAVLSSTSSNIAA